MQKVNKWLKREMRFPNKCQMCGQSLPPGSVVWMKRNNDDSAGKRWLFECCKCHQGGGSEEPREPIVSAPDLTPEQLEALSEIGGSGGEAPEVFNHSEPQEKRMTPLERLAAQAAWG